MLTYTFDLDTCKNLSIMKIIKSALLIALVLSLYSNSGSAQNSSVAPVQFTGAARLPYPLEWTSSVTDGQYLYTIGGYRGMSNFNTDLLRYDPQTNKWTVFIPNFCSKFQTTAVYLPSMHKIYVFGGIGGLLRPNHIIEGVQTVDINTKQVENLKLINPGASTYGGAVVWNNKIYLFGGSKENSHTLNTLYEFDPQTYKFTQLANMPETLQAAGTVVNGVIYTFGGYDAFTKHASSNIYAYHIAGNTWKKAGQLPEFVSANTASACGNLIFVAGNYDNEYFFGYYDTTDGGFTSLKTNIEPRRAAASAVINTTLYVIGGASRLNTSYTPALRSVQKAEVSTLLQQAMR